MQQNSDSTVEGVLAPGKGRPRSPLFLVLLGVMLFLSIVPLVVFGLLTLPGLRAALVTMQQERQLQATAAVVQRMDAFVEKGGREAIKLGQALAAQGTSISPSGLAFLSEFLDETVVLVSFTPARGQARTAVLPEVVLPDRIKALMERDARQILEQGATPLPPSARGAVLGGPYVMGPERVLAVTISAPVQRRGKLLGVLQEVAVFQQVWAQVVSAMPPPARVALLAPDGSVVASSGLRGQEGEASVNDREIVREFLGMRSVSPRTRIYDIESREGKAERCVGSFASTRAGWGVFVEIEEELALSPVQTLLNDVMYGGSIAAALAVVIALALGGFISRPVRRLAAISHRLADGDFSVRATKSGVLEIDELSTNFNKMAQKLGELVEKFRTGAREANDLFLGTIRALADAIDEKDPYTKGHSVRVNRYAVAIGRYLGLNRADLQALHVSALLHDVGKIGIDDAILKKPAALTDDEFDVMKSHPGRGAKIMGRIPQMKSIIPGVHFHHERYSGGGYPRGLKSDEIPMQARIIAVADTFDAMTTTRPYQSAFTVDQAVARINDLKGRSLDPEVVEAFNRAYEAGEFADTIASRPGVAQSDEAAAKH